MSQALHIVQKMFPNVTSVKDAKRDYRVEVSKKDTNSATVKNHKACAMAVACKRKFSADGVIMSVSTAYIIRGNRAMRFKVPEAVAREVVSFDRSGGFEAGSYTLKAIPQSAALGRVKGNSPKSSGPANGNLVKRFIHNTDNIRASLKSKGVV